MKNINNSSCERLSVEVVVLCGGLSTRFGRPKTGIKISHDTYIIDAITHKLKKYFTVHLSCNSDQKEKGLLDRFDCPLIVDQYEQIGPMGGLVSAMHALPGKNILLCGCDMPQLSLDKFLLLAKRFSEDPTVPLIASRTKNNFEPLFGVYPYSYHKHFLRAIELRQYGLQKTIKANSYHLIQFPENDLFNINTEADLTTYLSTIKV